MIKSDMISLLAREFMQYPEKNVAEAANDIMDAILSAIVQGQRIEIRGFGSFTLRYRAPRRAHNPKTGEKLHTQAKYTPHFKAGKELKLLVDQSRLKTDAAF